MSVAFDAVTSTSGSAVTSLSWTHTPSGTPTGVGVGVAWWSSSQSISSISYGASSLTAAVTSAASVGDGEKSSIWGLANPPSGNQTVTVSFSGGSIYGVSGAITVTGGNTSTVFSNTVSGASTTSGQPSVTCTSATGELVMDFGNTSNTSTVTAGAGQTERVKTGYGGSTGFSSTEAGAASVTMSWAITNDGWTLCAASFQAAAAAGLAANPLFGGGAAAGPMWGYVA